MSTIQTTEYKEFIKSIKDRVRQAQIKASVKVNTVLLKFYWGLGEDIIEKQKTASWGSGFLQQISKDLMHEFPEIKGFSLSNIQYIRRWVLFYTKSGTACATFTPKSIELLRSIPYKSVGCVSQRTKNSNQKPNIFFMPTNGALGNAPYTVFKFRKGNPC